MGPLRPVGPSSLATRRDLMVEIRAFIDDWNQSKHPFIWTKLADETLDKSNRNVTRLFKTPLD